MIKKKRKRQRNTSDRKTKQTTAPKDVNDISSGFLLMIFLTAQKAPPPSHRQEEGIQEKEGVTLVTK